MGTASLGAKRARLPTRPASPPEAQVAASELHFPRQSGEASRPEQGESVAPGHAGLIRPAAAWCDGSRHSAPQISSPSGGGGEAA